MALNMANRSAEAVTLYQQLLKEQPGSLDTMEPADVADVRDDGRYACSRSHPGRRPDTSPSSPSEKSHDPGVRAFPPRSKIHSARQKHGFQPSAAARAPSQNKAYQANSRMAQRPHRGAADPVIYVLAQDHAFGAILHTLGALTLFFCSRICVSLTILMVKSGYRAGHRKTNP